MAEARTIKLLALGDSLTAGWGLPAESSFPVQLQRALVAQGRDVKVINAGVSGDTTAGGRARLDWSLGDNPDAVMVELGANDALRGVDPHDTYTNLDAMLKRLEQGRMPVLLAGMLAPPNMGKAFGEQFAEVFTRLAGEHDVVFYPFFLDGVVVDPALTQGDGLHPTAEGVAIIVAKIMPSVLKVLDRVK
jgi:acyl-CoA thioesterase I